MAQPATATGGLTSPSQTAMKSNKDPTGSQILTPTAGFEQSPQDSAPNPPSSLMETLQSQSQQPTPRDTIGNLRKLSTALSAFQSCFNELQGHINCIQTAIESIVHTEPTNVTPQLPQQVKQASSSLPIEENQSNSELENLCITMNSRGLRKYMTSQLSEISKLREEVPKALKLAPNPARLILECLGRFFLQGSKAFADKKSPMIPAREASVLILECFLLMGIDGIEIEKDAKEEAEESAVAWRKRLITEGGLGKASKMDARGLLLLIVCFGIPEFFKYEDFRDLLHKSNANEIKIALQKSSFLISKIPEVIDWMVKNKMEVDAVDIAYTCGMEDQINPQKLLISFLRECKDSCNKRKKAAQGSPAIMNESNKKQLSALKSVIRCLEVHKVDPAKLLPGWQINEMIAGLEKEIAELNKKTTVQKRKDHETELPKMAKKFKKPQVKRSRLDGGAPSHLHSYYAPPTIYATGHPSIAENMNSSFVGPYAGRPYAGVHDQLCSDAGLYDRVGATQSYAYTPSSSLESSIALRNAAAAAAVGVKTADVYHDNSARAVSGVSDVPSHHTTYKLFF